MFIKSILLVEEWGHFWYIPVIIKFYFIAPLFILLYKFIHSKKPNLEIACFTIISLLFAVLFPYTKYTENSIQLRWYLPVYILGIIDGLIINNKCRFNKIQNIDIIIILVGIIAILIPTPFFREFIFKIKPSSYLQNKYLYMAIVWSLIFVTISFSNRIKEVLNNTTILHIVSKYSYQIYLIHYIVLIILTNYVSNLVIKGILTTIITIIISFFLNKIVYSPINKWRKNLFTSRTNSTK